MKIQRAAKLLTKATKLFPVCRKALWRLLSRLLPLYLKKIAAKFIENLRFFVSLCFTKSTFYTKITK